MGRHMHEGAIRRRRADGRLRAWARVSHLREYRTARRYEIGPAASDAPWYPDRNGGRNRQRILAGQDGHALIREVAGYENVLPNASRYGGEVRTNRGGPRRLGRTRGPEPGQVPA